MRSQTRGSSLDRGPGKVGLTETGTTEDPNRRETPDVYRSEGKEEKTPTYDFGLRGPEGSGP